MFLLSSDDLVSLYTQFIDDCDDATLLCAYIKTEELKKINISKKITKIVVRWNVKDLLLGSSDIDLFEYCKENEIALFRNERLHMKVVWDNYNRIIFGSSNISKRGLDAIRESNLEFNKLDDSLTFKERLYLQSIFSSSILVDDSLYEQLNSVIENTEIHKDFLEESFVKDPNYIDRVGFLLSDLPQIESPIEFYKLFSNRQNLSKVNERILIHDMVLFDIKDDEISELFFERLKINFNNHPFIVEFKDAVKRNNGNRPERAGSMNFGAVRLWFAENTTTVPTPRPFELSEYVQVLYTWICYFDDEFSWSVPGGHSQVIQYRAI